MPARDLKIDPLLHHPERHGIYTVKIKITLRLYFTSPFHDNYELQIQNFCRFVKRVIRSRISIFKKRAQNLYTGGFRGEKSRGKTRFEK